MHREDGQNRPTRAPAARKAPSAKEQELAAVIALEAAADRCFACYGAPCRCPPGRGLRAYFEQMLQDKAAPPRRTRGRR